MAAALSAVFSKRFASGVTVAPDLRVSLAPGRILVLFGPSGSGKTTIVRGIAGLERPDEGRIAFAGDTWVDTAAGAFVEPQGRHVGYVFQEAALFPHLTVRQNVAYGAATPSARRVTSGEGTGVDALLELVGAREIADRHPRGLSGGQAQRVALARALAAAPRLLLLDEPFAALDAPARAAMRRLLRAALERRGIPAVLVTHDRVEAIALGDAIAVVAGGRVRQVGAAMDVFRRPADLEVARSIGVESVLPAHVERIDAGLVDLRVGGTLVRAADPGGLAPAAEVFACIRAEDVSLERAAAAGSARNHLPARVMSIEPEGPIERLTLDCGFPLAALITRQAREEMGLVEGAGVVAAVKATAVHLVPKV